MVKTRVALYWAIVHPAVPHASEAEVGEAIRAVFLLAGGDEPVEPFNLLVRAGDELAVLVGEVGKAGEDRAELVGERLHLLLAIAEKVELGLRDGMAGGGVGHVVVGLAG